MAPRHRRHRRHRRPRRILLPLLIATILAAEITDLAIARSLTSAPVSGSAPAAAAVPTAAVPRTPNLVPAVDATRDAIAVTANAARSRSAAVGDRPPVVAPASPARTTSSSPAKPAPSTTYRGRNHVWIPSLGINRSVSSFPCSRTRPPDNYMYRWGCAGKNNVYLLGHSYSVFKPLHDAYVGGRLRKGMKVIYADGAGRVSTYSVIWWKVVRPTTAASWAWAAQSRPSMTLQTCVGAKSEYRLMVRLVKVG